MIKLVSSKDISTTLPIPHYVELRMEEEKRQQEEEAKRRAEEEERRIAEKAQQLFEERMLREKEAQQKELEKTKAEEEAAKRAEEETAIQSFKKFKEELLAKRAVCKSVGFLWAKGHEFEILTTPLSINIYNSFKTGTVVDNQDGDRLLDLYGDKNIINDLLLIMKEAYQEEDATFTIPSTTEKVAAESEKLIGKDGVYLVVHFPEFE